MQKPIGVLIAANLSFKPHELSGMLPVTRCLSWTLVILTNRMRYLNWFPPVREELLALILCLVIKPYSMQVHTLVMSLVHTYRKEELMASMSGLSIRTTIFSFQT